jgi:hypothetical protein
MQPYSDYDPQIQLYEIRALLDLVFTWRNDLHAEVSDADIDLRQVNGKGGDDEMMAKAKHDALLEQSCFRDTLSSQIAVSVLAPFIEAILTHEFHQLSTIHKNIRDSHQFQVLRRAAEE